jgi:archaellum biogenesis ATPase FlaH
MVFLISKMEGLPIQRAFDMAKYLMNHVGKTVNLQFIVDEKQTFTAPMNWDELRKYSNSNHGLSLPADSKDQLSIIEDSILKSDDQIINRPEIIKGFAKLGKIYVIAGGAKVGKSLFASRLACEISNGGCVWDHEMNKQNVLYFDTEMDPDDYFDRGLTAKQHDGLKFVLLSEINLPEEIVEADDEDRLVFYLTALKKYASKYGSSVIVIDCLYRLLNESSGPQINKFVSLLKEMKREGMLIFVVHHLNKSTLDEVDPFKNLSGHSNFQRAVDGGILLIPDEDSDDAKSRTMTIKYMARSFPQIPDKKVLFKDGVHILASDDGHEPQKNEIGRLKDFICENLPVTSDDAIPTVELAELISQCDDLPWTVETIKRYKLSKWVTAGYLNVTGNKPKLYYQGNNL